MSTGLTDIPQIFINAYEIQERGCLDYINGECDDCGICEIGIPDEVREILELFEGWF